MRTLAAVLALLTIAAAPSPKLMQWPDLLDRPMPAADAQVAYGADPLQVAELWLPRTPGRHRVVLMVHGGCWRSKVAKLSIMNFIAADLRARGLAVWNIEYRGVDAPGGGWPGTFDDVAAAADALKAAAAKYDLDISRVVVVGHSAGGHLGEWLAARPRLPGGAQLRSAAPLPVAAVVSLGGLADLEADKAADGVAGCGAAVVDRLTGTPTGERPDVFADTSPARALPLGVTHVVINAADDTLAPPWLGRAWADETRRAGDRTQAVVVPGGHVELIAPGTAAWARVAAEIERLTREK